ncbi:MAG: hypothetical protein RBS19_01655 [Bacteroidales bacterium]|nr:hypothetical protein [Bacteroidales bacterium]
MQNLKQLLIIVLLLLFSVCSIFAQKKVALHSNGTTTFFAGASPYVDAYNAAIDGDTIYLPGGTFSTPSSIQKRIVVYGVGHHPDSSAVLGETIITGGMFFYPATSKSHFEGLMFSNGSISYYGIADSIVLRRCYLTSINFGNYASRGNQIIENVIVGSIDGGNSVNTVISNNILKRDGDNVITKFSNNAWICNNIIVGTGYYSNYNNRFVLSVITDCLIDNNIILNEGSGPNFRIENIIHSTVSNNTFKNNVFNHDPTNATNIWENNYFGVSSDAIFTNYTGLVFDYAEDFHLLNPASYTGSTGNEVGIYGGYTPVKLGMIPENPHFQLKNIASETDENGELNIQIQVESQDY